MPSGAQACVAGDADFDLAVRRVFVKDDSHATLWVVPLATETASFPERAWLREVEVVDWGGATNLHIAPKMVQLHRSQWDLDGTEMTPPVSGASVHTFAVGDEPMSAMMGIEQMPLTGEDTNLPKLHLTWTCEMSNSSPHAIAISGRSGHVVAMSEMSPIQNRIVFWVANDHSDVQVAPEGRYLDYMSSKLTESEAGGWTFAIPLVGYNATFTGRLVTYGSSYKIYDGVVATDGGSQEISTKTLSPL